MNREQEFRNSGCSGGVPGTVYLIGTTHLVIKYTAAGIPGILEEAA